MALTVAALMAFAAVAAGVSFVPADRLVAPFDLFRPSVTDLPGAGTNQAMEVEIAEMNEETIGATTVNYTSEVHVFGYVEGEEITVQISWIVEEGAAEFEAFEHRFPFFTPTVPSMPVEGELIDVEQDGTTLNVTLRFSQLHWAGIGNAHFFLELSVDSDGDEAVDDVEKFGVTVHVETGTGSEDEAEDDSNEDENESEDDTEEDEEGDDESEDEEEEDEDESEDEEDENGEE